MPKARLMMLSVLRDVEAEEAGRERAVWREGRAWAGLRLVSGVWCWVLGGDEGLGRVESESVQVVGMNMIVLQSAESGFSKCDETGSEAGRLSVCVGTCIFMLCEMGVQAEKIMR